MDRGAWWAAVHFHFHALEKEMAAHSSVLAWKIPGTGEPGGLPSMGSHRVGHDWSDLAVAATQEYPHKNTRNDVWQDIWVPPREPPPASLEFELWVYPDPQNPLERWVQLFTPIHRFPAMARFLVPASIHPTNSVPQSATPRWPGANKLLTFYIVV